MALALIDDEEGKKALAVELYDRFHAMKTYGKEPESLESIIRIFKKDLAKYPTEKILKAISTHAERNDEFPTVSDISGLIKRNGRAPIKESDIISIRKKEVCDWSRAEGQLVEEWNRQQREVWHDVDDAQRQSDIQQENLRLRNKVKELESEIKRAWDVVRTKTY